ncbi:concanavalin A-like lectin/glucanase [Mollisia scopiformis]|uniref:Concanavalin A-like lectin/glucanase n=1 Tax=Mollisia scopiformis TaxID=149040 RepID=A0A194XDG5_MOLSC|nr:concanavalin A-like lectin/glucanase [Mollisia scopiformis]KUJ17797.1 concanavalin A-like lectin/glucanase [Mollisia scopiformis]
MALPSSMIAAVLLFALPIPTIAQTDNGNECSCFRTNGSSQGYFTYHRFHDYRDVATASTTPPTVISNSTNATNAFATSDFFLQDAWQNDWAIQNWNNSDSMAASGAAVTMINSPNNVYIEKSTDNDPTYSSYLVLRTSRLPDFQSAAEIDSTEQNFHYVSARFMARVIGAPGACAGLFTYLASDNPQSVQEADIEILTAGPRDMVQYTNQPSTDSNGDAIPQATVNGTNPGARDWTLWNTYRVDWMPKMTSWYVNGEGAANISFQTPKDPAGLILNMWSDGGVWTGNMSLYDEAYLQIQWMEFVYNTSGAASAKRDEHGPSGLLEKRKGGTPGCKVVCGVDEDVNITGTPAFLYNSTAPMGWRGDGMGIMAWIPVVLAGAALFGYF